MIQCVPTKSDKSQVKVTFALATDDLDGKVAVVGDFNAWDPGATVLKKRGETYRASVVLPTGQRYPFRYLTTDGRWFNDGAADDYESNEFGVDNGIIDLTD